MLTCVNVVSVLPYIVLQQAPIMDKATLLLSAICDLSSIYLPATMSKRARADTAGNLIGTESVLLKSLQSLSLEAQEGLVTNPNADPFGIITTGGCNEGDPSFYPDDSKIPEGATYMEHSFKESYPHLFMKSAPGHGTSWFL